MKNLWKYMRPHKWLIVSALILSGIGQVLNLIDPIIFGKIIDDYALNPDNMPGNALVRGVVFWLGIAVAVALLARLARTMQDYIIRLTVQKFGIQIFNDGLKQTLRLPYDEFEEQPSGETLSILQKVRRDTQMFINSSIMVLFSTIVGLVFLIVYSVTKNWMLIPVFIVGIAIFGSLTGLLSKEIKATQRAINRETNRMSGVITESLRNIELVKSLGLTFPEIRRLHEHNQLIFDLEMRKVRRVRTLSFFQGATMSILKHSILFILLWLIFRRVLTTGELITMQFISTAIFGPMQDLGTIILSYREVEASASTFERLMNKPIERNPENPVVIDSLNEIRFHQVYFRHKTAVSNAIDGISFQVKTGETIAFVGPSGSGKSTLVKLLLGLYRPTSGEIFFNGFSASRIKYNPFRRQIGFVAQDPQLFSGSIRENLLFVRHDATEAEMLDALHRCSCDELLKGSDLGMDTVIGEGGLKLSGGEKQRISIARALLRQPRLLLFDEATSSLDSLTEENITKTIRNISMSKTRISVIIAHRLSTILHADMIYVLEKGRIVETGTHDHLLEQRGLYYALWRQQIGERRDI